MPRRSDQLLRVESLRVSVPARGRERVEAVHGASFTVARGEAVGLVGESGSGKTLTCRAVLGVLPREVSISGGSITFDGLRLDGFSRRQWEGVRGGRIG